MWCKAPEDAGAAMNELPVIVQYTDFEKVLKTVTELHGDLPLEKRQVLKAIGVDTEGKLWKFNFDSFTKYDPPGRVSYSGSSQAYNFEQIQKLPEPGEEW